MDKLHRSPSARFLLPLLFLLPAAVLLVLILLADKEEKKQQFLSDSENGML